MTGVQTCALPIWDMYVRELWFGIDCLVLDANVSQFTIDVFVIFMTKKFCWQITSAFCHSTCRSTLRHESLYILTTSYPKEVLSSLFTLLTMRPKNDSVQDLPARHISKLINLSTSSDCQSYHMHIAYQSHASITVHWMDSVVAILSVITISSIIFWHLQVISLFI